MDASRTSRAWTRSTTGRRRPCVPSSPRPYERAKVEPIGKARVMSNIGWSGLALSLILVVIAMVVSLWKQLGLERSIAWASARAAAQLIAIGLLLRVLLEPGVS